MELQSGANMVVVTLNDSISLTDPDFVFVFVSDSTHKKVACKVGTDLSEYPDRYNKFVITVKSSPVALNSEVNLETLGFHKYYVYEMEDASGFDFAEIDSTDLDTISGLVEQGKMKYVSSSSDPENYIDQVPSIKHYAD